MLPCFFRAYSCRQDWEQMCRSLSQMFVLSIWCPPYRVLVEFPSALGAAVLSCVFCVTGGGPGQRAISQQPQQQESLQASGNVLAPSTTPPRRTRIPCGCWPLICVQTSCLLCFFTLGGVIPGQCSWEAVCPGCVQQRPSLLAGATTETGPSIFA